MADLMQRPILQALAWALVHFVWQGAAIALVTFVAFRLLRLSASARYAIGVGALVAMLAAPAATFVILVRDLSPVAASDPSASTLSPFAGTARPAMPTSNSAVQAPATGFRVSAEVLAVAVVGWIAGVMFFSLRLVGGWVVARRLARRAIQPASDAIQAMARSLADDLALDRAVAVVQSSLVAVPVLIGWLKPTIVLPVAALTSLSPAQVEALIAHELAHIRRHDYLVNLLQSVAEALLFYHPAVWWLSRRVRAERELCCDDVAVGMCDRLVYATALNDLAAMATPTVVLAATDGDLLSRVRRILGHEEARMSMRSGVVPVLTIVMLAGLGAPVALMSATQTPAVDRQVGVAIAGVASEQPLDLALAEVASLAADQNQVDPKRLEELQRRLEELQKVLREQGDLSAKLRELRTALDQLKLKETVTARDREAAVERARKSAGLSAEQRDQAARERLELAQKVREAVDKSREAQLEAARRQSNDATVQIETARARAEQSRLQQDLTRTAREAELAAARQQFEDAQRRYEKGLIPESTLREARVALARAEGQGDAAAEARADLEAAKIQLDRARTLFERGLMSQGQVAAAEQAVATLEQRSVAAVVANQQARERQQLAETIAAVQAQQAETRAGASARELYDLLVARRAMSGADQSLSAADRDRVAAIFEKVAAGVELAATERAAAGTVVRIAIEGEPDLPPDYVIRQDGTIRIPFVGTVKVAGLNAAQVREAVGKALAAKNLGSINTVKVTLWRIDRRR